jgi:hypothetical protein
MDTIKIIGRTGKQEFLAVAQEVDMAYSSFPPSMQVITSEKQGYVSEFQAIIDSGFDGATTSWDDVLEERPFASKIFVKIKSRINHLINAETGVKMGDDYKTILFRDLSFTPKIGNYYQFNDNYWLVINTEIVKNLAATATLRRCNNVLKWIDEATGAYFEEPCNIEYLVKEPRDYSTAGSSVVTPSGYFEIRTQFNERTNKIRPNQRFLFGNPSNWLAFKVVGTGVNLINNQQTFDNMSTGMMVVEVAVNYTNSETDDLVNGIADVYQNVYSLSILDGNLTGFAGTSVQLQLNVLYNGESVTRSIEWTSSNVSIATVSSTGLLNFLSNGTATITAKIQGNSAQTTITATTLSVPTDTYQVKISPNINYILEGQEPTFTAYLYKNNVVQADAFIFTPVPNGIPASNYTFTVIDGNSFKIKNTKFFIASPLSVVCTSGTHVSIANIYLKGAW